MNVVVVVVVARTARMLTANVVARSLGRIVLAPPRLFMSLFTRRTRQALRARREAGPLQRHWDAKRSKRQQTIAGLEMSSSLQAPLLTRMIRSGPSV